MKAKTLQIVWHCKEPVLTVDFCPNNPNVFATGGADKDIKFWEVCNDASSDIGVNYLCSLGGTSHAVNVLRFSPLGDSLVSGGDSGTMCLWRPVDPASLSIAQKPGLGQEADEKPSLWKLVSAMRGHAGDVHDVAWSPDGSALVSGSVENLALLWDVEAKRGVVRLEGHQHYVQGVAWDPLGFNLVTLSNDRTARVYAPKVPKSKSAAAQPPASSVAMLKDFNVTATLVRRIIPDNNDVGSGPDTANNHHHGSAAVPAGAGGAASTSHAANAAAGPATAAGGTDAAAVAAASSSMPAPAARHALFQDETFSSFFRRPAFSPDGSFVILPAGMFKAEAGSCAVPTSYIFARGDWAAPVAHLPSLTKPTVAVRFSPVLYRYRDVDRPTVSGSSSGSAAVNAGLAPPPAAATASGPCGLFEGLPYRMVWAVATMDSVMIYDTTSLEPVVILGGLHMACITDMAWSPDGRSLAVTSMDGYCSLAVFDQGDLGDVIPSDQLPANVASIMERQPAKAYAERMAKQVQRMQIPAADSVAAAGDKAGDKSDAAGAATATTIGPSGLKPAIKRRSSVGADNIIVLDMEDHPEETPNKKPKPEGLLAAQSVPRSDKQNALVRRLEAEVPASSTPTTTSRPAAQAAAAAAAAPGNATESPHTGVTTPVAAHPGSGVPPGSTPRTANNGPRRIQAVPTTPSRFANNALSVVNAAVVTGNAVNVVANAMATPAEKTQAQHAVATPATADRVHPAVTPKTVDRTQAVADGTGNIPGGAAAAATTPTVTKRKITPTPVRVTATPSNTNAVPPSAANTAAAAAPATTAVDTITTAGTAVEVDQQMEVVPESPVLQPAVQCVDDGMAGMSVPPPCSETAVTARTLSNQDVQARTTPVTQQQQVSKKRRIQPVPVGGDAAANQGVARCGSAEPQAPPTVTQQQPNQASGPAAPDALVAAENGSLSDAQVRAGHHEDGAAAVIVAEQERSGKESSGQGCCISGPATLGAATCDGEGKASGSAPAAVAGGKKPSLAMLAALAGRKAGQQRK